MRVKCLLSSIFLVYPAITLACLKADWTFFSKNRKYLIVSDDRLDCLSAYDFCEEMGGQSLIIPDLQTSQFVQDLLDDQNCLFPRWIGLNNLNSGDYHWVDGTPLGRGDFSNWKSKNRSTNITCISMVSCRDGKWEERNPEDKLRYICEAMDPCAARPVLSVGVRVERLENTTVTFTSEQEVEITCSLRGYSSPVTNVSLFCESLMDEVVGLEDVVVRQTIFVNEKADGKKCVCASFSKNGMKEKSHATIIFKNDLKQAVSALASCFPNVVLASKPEKIIYAHMSRLMADIVCMRDLLKSKVPWRYLINTAATGFPLRTNGEMVQILKILTGKNDIHEVFAARLPLRWEVEYRVIKGKIKATNKPMPPPPHNLTVLKGQAYNTYSREFLHWAMRDRRAKDLLRWSAKTYSPDEHYWATLNNLYHNPFLNAPGGFKGDPDQKGYITMVALWATNKNQRHSCQGRNVHNICLFGVGDLNYLRTKMFLTCNKLDLGFDPVAYSCLEEWLESRTLNSDLEKFDSNFYKRLRFIWYNNDKEKLEKWGTTRKQKKKIKKERNGSRKDRDRDREKKKDKTKEQTSDKELEIGDNEKHSDTEETKNRKVIKKRKEEMRTNGRPKDGKERKKNENEIH